MRAPTVTGLRAAALRYAAGGWPVLPCHWTDGDGCSCGNAECHSPGKHPRTVNGVRNASSDPARIAAWWDRWPLANVAIATGYPGPDVVDVDTKHGRDGDELYNLARVAGALGEPFAIVSTPSGGRHAYHRGTRQGGGAVGASRALELKAVGGYVLAPPSVIFGHAYSLTTTSRDAGTVVDFDAVRRVLTPARPATRLRATAERTHDGLIRHVAGMTEGNVNNALFWAACRAVENGADESVFAALADAAVSAGHPRPGAVRTVASARRRAF